ncbi:stanniocalcin-like protein [Elysia marginata]|uniref:Stanniocalcin-like protein n=1 Tax=Elysia marginata TaxID=1093978 RepID=A0AAV4JBF1_9GAST|nr:stanniocalcin-like protein [Elysia marginata]
MATKLFIIAILINASFAFWFHRPTPVAQADGREVDEACLQHAQNGNCEFYTCFDNRLPCGDDYYMKKHGSYYCNKTTNNMHRFTAAGQQFLTDIKVCLMEPLQELYTRDFIDCHDLEHEAVAAIAPCFNEYNFCEVLRTNAEEFFRIYEVTDLFTRGAGKIWRAILRIATDCGSQYTRQFSSDLSETLLNSANDFMNSLGSLPINNIFGSDDTEETP